MPDDQDDPFKSTADSLHAYRRRIASHLDEMLADKKNRGDAPAVALIDDVKEDFAKLVNLLDASRVVVRNDSFHGELKLYDGSDMRRPVDAFVQDDVSPRNAYSTETADDYSRIIHSRSFRRLQGKTQLFPAGESDLLRTRLTHTLEVAEIASRIAGELNQRSARMKKGGKIDIAIVTAAALAHDIGHPPFGHQGEAVLNEIMAGFGGFEGNAQTLRIITKLENRFSSRTPARKVHWDVLKDPKGLNLLYRSIASTIKYDKRIQPFYSGESPAKGYYASEQDIIDDVKARLNIETKSKLYTIECQIMDLADDIAYSTYDLEDCITSEVATLFDVIALQRRDEIGEVKALVNKALHNKYNYKYELTSKDIQLISFNLFSSMVSYAKDSGYSFDRLSSAESFIAGTFLESKGFGDFALYRRRWTEEFIRKAVRSIHIEWNQSAPALSSVEIGTPYRIYIEFLKAFNYVTAIRTKKLRLNDQRSRNILLWLFHAFLKQPYHKNAQELALFPHEVRAQYEMLDFTQPYKGLSKLELKKWNAKISKDVLARYDIEIKDESLTFGMLAQRMRFVCDYIASLTDDEALQLYKKLMSTDRVSVFGFGF